MDFAWNKCVFLEKILELCIVWWGTTSNQDKMRDRLSGQFFCYFFAEYNYIIFFIWTSFIHANCHLTTYFVAALVVLHTLQIIRFHWRRWKCQGQTLSRKFWNHFLHIDCISNIGLYTFSTLSKSLQLDWIEIEPCGLSCTSLFYNVQSHCPNVCELNFFLSSRRSQWA